MTFLNFMGKIASVCQLEGCSYMVTRFCNTVFPIFAKRHKIYHGNANYWPRDCFFNTNLILNIN